MCRRLLQESLAEQLEEGYRQAIWLPARGRLQTLGAAAGGGSGSGGGGGGGYAARLELTTHVERGLYALFVSGKATAWLLGCLAVSWPCPSCWPARCGLLQATHTPSPGNDPATAPVPLLAEEEVFLCQETGWGWLRRIGASSTAGQQRLRLRRGYEQPTSRVRGASQHSGHSGNTRGDGPPAAAVSGQWMPSNTRHLSAACLTICRHARLLLWACLPATCLQALLDKEADLRQEQLDEACAAAPISRLVLLVHGVGQKLEAADIAQDAGSFRSVLRQVAQDQSQQGLLDEQPGAGRLGTRLCVAAVCRLLAAGRPQTVPPYVEQQWRVRQSQPTAAMHQLPHSRLLLPSHHVQAARRCCLCSGASTCTSRQTR